MTGNERIQDNTEYDAFIVAVPFVKTLSDLRRYLRSIRSQRRLLEAAIPVIENNNTHITSSLVHLPKTQLPTFSGDCVAFLSFWNTFKAGVHDLPISDSIKFTYLKQCLSGSPLTLISSLPVTDESYESALELLRKNYDNPNEVARSLHNSLRKLPHVRAGENFCTDLRLLLDKIEGICVQMSQRNQSFNTTSFQMEIEERLPRFVLDEIFKAKENDPEWDSLKLKNHLHNILKRKEQIETLTLNSHNTPKQIRTSQLQTPSPQNNKPPPILSFHTQGDNQNKNNNRSNNKKPKWPCLFCENPSHFSANCETYLSIKQRKDKLRALKRCFSCLRPNHLANQCTKPSQCSNCQGKHPRALCPNIQNRSSYYNSNLPPNIQESGPRQTQALNLNNQHVQAVSIPHPIPMPLSQIAQSTPPVAPDTPPYQANLASVNTESINKRLILLKCVRVMLFNPNNPLQEREVILLMDDASTNSYITLNEAKNLKLNLTPRTIKLGVFNSPSCKVVQAYTTQFGIRLANGRSIIVTANAAEHLTQNTNYVPFTPQLLSYPELISNNKVVQPSVLLGSDYYYEVEPTPLLRLPSGHHLIHTLFGPIVAGKGFIPRNTNQPNQINCAIQPQLEAPSNEFFSLEGIGIKDLPRLEDQDMDVIK
uniref:CCHC-type domain-containing protein n=1 Tax=Meloidogyne incognita TaxID=6306 RepID=A0A914N604_MELIC